MSSTNSSINGDKHPYCRWEKHEFLFDTFSDKQRARLKAITDTPSWRKREWKTRSEDWRKANGYD